MPRCGALSLLQKTPHYRGDPAETAATLSVKLCVLVVRVGILPLIKAAGIKSRDSEIKSRRGAGPFAGHSQLLICSSVLRSLPPAAPPASPTFMKAHRKSGGRDLTEEEIRAEAHKRQKEMGDAARAAEMTKEGVAFEKRKGLAEKEAARKAATGQAGKDKRAAGDATRWAKKKGCSGYGA